MSTYIRLVLVWFWYGFGSGLNHTKTIPQIRIFWFGFDLVFEAEPASKTNQKRTKNQTNIFVQHEHDCTE